MSNLENALVWLYIKTWGKFGDHVIKEKDLWKFDAEHLEAAIMGLTHPSKKYKNELVKALSGLIMKKFEGGGPADFREWSSEIHCQVIETVQESVGLNTVAKQVTTFHEQQPTVIKILEWDPGKYLILLSGNL